MPHKELGSKEAFEAAIAAAQGKFVVLYCYEGEINPKAEEASEKYSAAADSYKVDVSKQAMAKQALKVTVTPTIVIYKDGAEVKRIEGVNEENAKEIASVLG